MHNLQENIYFKWAIFILAVILSAGAFIWFVEQWETDTNSLGIDWVHYAIKDGNIRYDITDGLRNPPWSVLVMLPLGFMSEKAGWGMLMYINMVVLIAAVPQSEKRGVYWVAVLLLVTSYFSLRTAADANFEILVTAGALLIVYGYRLENPFIVAGGVLLISAKPQSSILLLLVLAGYILQTWSRQKWLLMGGTVLAFVIPTMIWKGEDWLRAVDGTYQRGSLIDTSLRAALQRTEIVPDWVGVILVLLLIGTTFYLAWVFDRSFSREKAGMLIAASLLVAPYAAGNSYLAVAAIGIMAIFISNTFWIGITMMVLVNLPYALLFLEDRGAKVQSYYITLLLCISYGVLAWRCYQHELPQTPQREAAVA